jgi:arginase
LADIQKKVDIIGVQSDLGAKARGFNLGPLAIRKAGVCDKLSAMGFSLRDKGDIIPDPGVDTGSHIRNYKEVAEINGRLFEQVKDSLQVGAFPVILGGDHSVSAGSILAVAGHYGDVGVIWVDAHGDFNDDQSSPSGNLNGMPFSAVCGLGPNEMAPDAKHYVNPKHAVLIGARDLDTLERPRLRDAGVAVFTVHDIDRLGMNEVIRQAVEIAAAGTKGIHVSFDVDSVTPESAPGVGAPVHRGMTVREAFFTMELLHQCGKILSLDMVEVNPILDESNRTAILACELILSLMGKTLY